MKYYLIKTDGTWKPIQPADDEIDWEEVNELIGSESFEVVDAKSINGLIYRDEVGHQKRLPQNVLASTYAEQEIFGDVILEVNDEVSMDTILP